MESKLLETRRKNLKANLTLISNGSRITTMDAKQNKSQTIKIWKVTLKKLRFIRAHTGERMVGILDRLVKAELEIHERKE